MAQEKDPRITKAFIAMKSIGIPAEKTKPVLKRLLKLYDRKWELIEENNYSTLADAIFEYENENENEKKSDDQNGLTLNHNLKTQFKKPQGAHLEDQASSTMGSGGERPDAEFIGRLEGEGLSLSRNPREDPTLLHQASVRGRGRQPSSTSQASLAERECITGPSSLHKRKEKMQENHQLALHKRKNLGSFIQPLIPCPSNVHLDKGKRVLDGSSCQSSFDIVSSSCGKVKVLLACENNGIGQPSSQSPNLEAIVKHAEDKCLRSYKIIGPPKFSLIQSLKELCNSFLELGSNSDVKLLSKESSDDMLNEIMGPNQESVGRDNRETQMNKRMKSSASSNSIVLALAQQKAISHTKRSAIRKIKDISNGTEKVSIPLLDEIGNEHLPDFVYIPQNTIYQSAYVQVSLARISDEDCCARCRGNCLSSSVPCECARDTGGEYAYTPEGLLKEKFLADCNSMNEEPQKHYHFYCEDCPLERAKNASRPQKCKGHLVRKFVKECWRKCRCSMECGNRVVQRGITRKLQVFLADQGKGWGVRPLEELPKGAFVCEYIGEILTNMELYERNTKSSKDRHTYPVLLDADWGSEGVLKDEDALCLDATYYGNVARFVNHRCYDSNLIAIPVEVETPDHHYYHVWLDVSIYTLLSTPSVPMKESRLELYLVSLINNRISRLFHWDRRTIKYCFLRRDFDLDSLSHLQLAFFTKRKVYAMEELTWDYGIDFDDINHPIEAFKCCCGSDYCRDAKVKVTKQNRPK